MKWMVLLFWALAGLFLAVVFLLMQRWTVNTIQPDRRKGSKRLVIGGAFLRWCLFSTMMIFALQNGLAAGLSAFFSFMTTRLILLYLVSRLPLPQSKETRLQ